MQLDRATDRGPARQAAGSTDAPIALATLFPGQGSQKPGMGERFCSLSDGAKQVFARSSDCLGRDIETLCFRSTDDELRDTANAQLAIVVTALAARALILEFDVEPVAAAGHSVGEFAAVVAAGCLSLEAMLPLLDLRARLMSALDRAGSMVSVSRLPVDAAAQACEEASTPTRRAVIAVINHPEQAVISGHTAAVETAAQLCRERGGHTTQLDVSHAFHSPLMDPIAERWTQAVAEAPIMDPALDLVGNVSGDVLANAAAVREELATQPFRTVRWAGSLSTLSRLGVTTAIECGDSRVLTGISRRVPEAPPTTSATESKTLRLLRDRRS